MEKNKSSGNRSLVFMGVLIVVVAVVAAVLWMNNTSGDSSDSGDVPFNGLVYENPEPATDFTLSDQNGNRVSLSDYRGKLVMMYFGFTNCPDQCPVTMAIWSRVQDQLGERADQVQFLFVTIDPLRDSPEQIAEYLSNYAADITGLTGSLEEIEDVATDYSVFFEIVDAGDDSASDSSDMSMDDDTADDDGMNMDSESMDDESMNMDDESMDDEDHDHDAEHDDEDHEHDTSHDDDEGHDHDAEHADDESMNMDDESMDGEHTHDELDVYNYWVNHTALTFLIDKEGNLVLAFPYETREDAIISDLEHWLD